MSLRGRSYLATVLFFGVASAQQIASRDLVGVKPEWRKYDDSQCGGIGSGSGGGIGGSGAVESRPTLHLTSLNGTVFQRGEEIIATVQLVNTTNKDFWIPWQENPAEFEPADGEIGRFKTMNFHLAAIDKSGKEPRTVFLQTYSQLFSSVEEGSSQLLLKSGEAAQVRFATRLDCDSKDCWPKEADQLEIEASWFLSTVKIDRTKKCASSYNSAVVENGESNNLNIRIEKLETRN